MKLLSIPVLTLGLTVLAQGGSVFTFSALPPSVSTGDSFVVTVSVTPGPTDQVNAFSVDLIYLQFPYGGPAIHPHRTRLLPRQRSLLPPVAIPEQYPRPDICS